MAAKPPKPSENFLKQLDDCLSHNNKNNNNQKSLNKSNVSHLNTYKKDDNANGIISTENSNEIVEELFMNGNNNATPTSSTASKSNCNCTNISIMHLFHEMKQIFPTIPDTIVTQCVNENCHQRENCIKQLQNELALNPMPIQSYPAKVLHPIPRLQSASKTSITPNAITSTTSSADNLLKPSRPAPVKPPIIAAHKPIQGNSKPPGQESLINLPQQNLNCDNRSAAINSNKRNNGKAHQCNRFDSFEKDVESNIGDCEKIETQTNTSKTSDMPTTTKSLTYNSVSDCVNETQAESRENVNSNLVVTPCAIGQETPSSVVPRTRPTTLNFRTQFQQQQRQQINIQLQKHFQQRNLQQHQNKNSKQQQSQFSPLQTKPLRKAPLPPIPPKPAQFSSAGAHSPLFHHSTCHNSVSPNNNNNVNNNCGLIQSQQSSFSNDSSLTSPTSSIGDSELSVNVSLSSPIVAYQPGVTPTSQTSLKSPIRHRSVITVHPEPPYTKDFIGSPTSCVNPTVCTAGQKSFTSVNLTLRQPSINSSIPASTIDISAGPGLSGNSSGLTYSSTSYDARRGYQKNFHITVTDQGGVFSASHLRPHSCFHADGSFEQNNSSTSPTTNNQLNPLRTASSEQCVAQKFQQNNIQVPQQEQQLLESLQDLKIVASNNIISTTLSDNEMCVQSGHDALTETLERQKTRRDKLSTILRGNKKKLSQLEEEINVLAEPISSGENERLDNEIQKLRSDCEAMLNNIDFAKKCVYTSLPYNGNNNSNNRQQPQPFPRQRQHRSSTTRLSPSTTSPGQSQLDFIQHNSSGNITNPVQSSNPQTPTTYQQGPNLHLTDEEDYTNSFTDTDDDDDEEPLQRWACTLCTFRNHPQLNICECCDNPRIMPEPLLSREDIHITLSPGENRIIHSWVVS